MHYADVIFSAHPGAAKGAPSGRAHDRSGRGGQGGVLNERLRHPEAFRRARSLSLPRFYGVSLWFSPRLVLWLVTGHVIGVFVAGCWLLTTAQRSTAACTGEREVLGGARAPSCTEEADLASAWWACGRLRRSVGGAFGHPGGRFRAGFASHLRSPWLDRIIFHGKQVAPQRFCSRTQLAN